MSRESVQPDAQSPDAAREAARPPFEPPQVTELGTFAGMTLQAFSPPGAPELGSADLPGQLPGSGGLA